ncbi:MAG: primosomal protein N' [Bacilli bacterium]|nr:primosomal protein N' [Bacilli bacterium]MDD3304821.1 primosomal protein N' [Bacilli bacterium]MDD4053408.1 primosomal protein N' [Bacilli bacterium]MDD4410945.1 primosomal protein N' [Bacilli bacterium]
MTVDVLVEVSVGNQNQMFTYNVEQSLQPKIKTGIRVIVPFGSRKLEGFVININNTTDIEYDLKNIIEVVDEKPVLNEELLDLGNYMSDFYLAPLIHCYQTMLPVALKAKRRTKVNVKCDKYIYINKDEKTIEEYIKHNKSVLQNNILSQILSLKKVKKQDINNQGVLRTLINKELLKEVKEEVYRFKTDDIDNKEIHKLTDDQQRVVSDFLKGDKDVFLLRGVTGSGKTEVYMDIIDKMLVNGKTAIVLVPEIALTTQLVARFQNHFGTDVAILHSRLSDGEKYDEWRKIEREEVSIVIGARSAIFAPLNNIGVIIIDEEHEGTYKQENSPRYHAHDIAMYRAKKHGAKVLLGAATPSLESYARAKIGLYGLLELENRINGKNLPKVIVVDMKDSIKKGHRLLSLDLAEKIKLCLEKKEQIMILLNRRGYSNYLVCSNCGYTYKCPHCDITMTYHKTSDTLRCHYCGYADKRRVECPSCHEKNLKDFGIGTEKIEEELKKIFNEVRIVRMDLDTTTKKGSHSKIIKDFEDHKYDILLGTQMIAKGLDFPRVTLVGVINADMGLNIPDFRSSERTFQLLSQVAGRSGRSKLEGEVILQVFNSDHYVIEAAKKHDYIGFYNRELAIRKKLFYPPFCFIAMVRVLSKDYDYGFEVSKRIGTHLREKLPNKTVLGPTMANVFKVNNVYRFACLIKYKEKTRIYTALREILNHYDNNRKIKVEIEINPMRF